MKTPISPTLRAKGFALVVTISLLVLLSVIALGFLSLSAVTLRSGSQDQAQMEARANARLALQIAIGELQKHTGADTRVTAPATIVDENYPQVLGVWRSWEGTDHEPNGRPIAPDYSAKEQAESSGGRFIDWLVSSAKTGSTPSIEDAPVLVSTSSQDNTVPLLAAGSLLPTDPRQVHVAPTRLEDTGHIAWWISGENQKARLAQPYQPRTASVAGLAEMGQSHTIANPEVFGLAELLDDPEPHDPAAAAAKPASKAVSRQTMALVKPGNATVPQEKFHDLSSWSIGLLTNTATGGWRKDLSLLTEKWDEIYASYPGGKLPLFRLLPEAGETTEAEKPPTGTKTFPGNRQYNLYPWSNYSTVLGYQQPATYHAASASWASLRSFATSYKNFIYDSGVVKTAPDPVTNKSTFFWDKIAKQTANAITASEIYNYQHKQRLAPQIARFQFLIYAQAFETSAPGANPKRYQIRLLYAPFFTLWNPYNVALEHTISGTLGASQGSGQEKNFLGLGWRRSLPGVMAIVNQASYPGGPNTVPNNQYRLLNPGNFQTLDWPNNNANPYDTFLPTNVAKYGANNKWVDKRTFGCWLPEGTLTFGPGEAKIFSPGVLDPAYPWSGVIRLKEGYSPTDAVGVIVNGPGNLLASQSYWFLFRTDRATQPYRDRQPGSGFSVSFGDGSSHFGAGSTMPTAIGDEFHNITALVSESDGEEYWPPDEVDEVGYSVAELASGAWIPIFSTSFGPRMTIGTGSGTKQNRPTKGVLQNNPLAAMVLSDPASGQAKDHPVNNTFDFAYHSLSIGSTITPNLSDSKGFIATGYQSGDGLSRLVMCNIPLRPMMSLVELEGWNPRGHNPYPPFQVNLIGNSDATPLIPNNQVVPDVLNPPTVQTNLMHDDAYCANHLLFDDWFVSSIAPDPEYFGQSNSRDINTVYRDFLKGESRLANRAYLPISEDSKVSDAVATERIGEIINSPGGDGWLKVASRFEVEGMFNVNSTSVEAWKALLGHAKSLDQIAMHGANGIVAEDVSDEHVVTRGSIATDVKAGSGAGFGGQFAAASEYTGFRSLSDDQIGDLAEKVVEQVRLRGPFLSLSEFVNRHLVNNDSVALAGAVQTAINNLTNDPMATLRDPDNRLSDDTMPLNDDKLDSVDYEYPEAATGSSAYGAPGWIRQADILRPIAPILSVRDDTFTIRAYGDSVDQKGNVIARAWCEAVVKRTREFNADSDAADSVDPPANDLNKTFGRRYEIVSFRWLHQDEV